MITASEARALADAAPRQNKWVPRFDADIVSAARMGRRSVLLCFTDCGEEQREAMRIVEDKGFRIAVRPEYSNGVRQTRYYAEW